MADRLRFLALILTAALCAPSALAAQLSGKVVDAGGSGIEAVVWVDAPSGERSKNPPTVEMKQEDKAFVPRMQIVEVGQAVRFPNEDHVFHNVFSASKGNAFDLGLFKADAKYDEKTLSKIEKGPEAGVVRFKSPGRVDVFCNIHPKMTAVIVVTPHEYHARTNSDGEFTLKVPAGKVTLKALDEAGNEASAAVSGPGPAKIVFKDRSTAVKQHLNKQGQPYKAGDADKY
ncbi:MAG: hypothetical protein HY075_08425 [Deltaproteobacteria bacterium]|nr:hypothetical protein [Deltaproteobacteria bacterium]